MKGIALCRVLGVLVAVLTLCAGTAMASDTEGPSHGLLKLKAGSCIFTLLDSNGVKPIADSTLSLASVKDGKSIAKTAPDRMGRCVLNVPEGRHILRVNERNITIVEASDAAKIKECRILLSEDALVVGGQEEEVEKKKKGGAPWLTGKTVVIGTVAVLTAGAGYAIYEHNKDDDEEAPGPPISP